MRVRLIPTGEPLSEFGGRPEGKVIDAHSCRCQYYPTACAVKSKSAYCPQDLLAGDLEVVTRFIDYWACL